MPRSAATTSSSAPIKWHGGKSYLAARIIDMMPAHTHYVEPYFGGGAVLFRKPSTFVEGHSEVVNDKFGELVNFWRVLQSPTLFTKFQRRIAFTPFAQEVWNKSVATDEKDSVSRACSFFVKYRQSRQGLGRCFATMSRNRTRRGMNEQVSSWLSAIEGLDEAHARLQRVAIFCDEATSVMKREDDKSTLFYCDPPYLASTRVVANAYTCEMEDSDHQKMLDALCSIRGRFILSGYRNDLYDDYAKQDRWKRVDFEIDNKASGKKVKPTKTECLWYNF